MCLFVVASVFSGSVALSFAYFWSIVCFYIVFLRCNAYDVFMNCGTVFH